MIRTLRRRDWWVWVIVGVFILGAGRALALELVRQKNTATVIQFPLVGSSDDVAFTDCTTGADTEYSTFTDGTAGPSAYTDITNEIALTSSATGIHWVSLTAAEMNYDYITILVKSSSCNTLFIPIRTVAANPHYQAATDDGGAINVTTGAVDTVTTTTTATTCSSVTALAANAIGTGDIASGAITADAIATDAIGAAEIADGAIDSGAIATAAIDADAIAADAITSSELADNAIDAGAIATDAIGSAEIAADAITASEIATDAIGADEIAAGAITSSELTSGTVTLANGAHGGASASLTLGAGASISSSSGNALALTSTAVSGSGLYVTTSSANRYAIEAAGTGATDSGGIKASAATAGEGIEAVAAGNGHGLYVIGAGTGEGIHATGGGTAGGHGAHFEATGANNDGLRLTANGTGIDLNADITGNITGNLSGSVGSVTGAVGSVTGNVGGNVTGSVGSVASGGITAASIATGAVDADALATDAGDEIADEVWDEALSGHLGAGSTGAALNAAGSAGDPWSTAIPGAYGAGTAGYIVGTYVNATISSRSTLDAAAVNAEVDTALADVNLDHLVGTATGIPSVVSGTYLDQIMDDGTATYDRTTDSLQAIRDNLSGGAADWTATEREQIRYRLGIDGDESAPLANTDQNLPDLLQDIRDGLSADHGPGPWVK